MNTLFYSLLLNLVFKIVFNETAKLTPYSNSTMPNLLDNDDMISTNYSRENAINWCWYPCYCFYYFENGFSGSYSKCWCWYPCGCWHNQPYLRGGVTVSEAEPNVAIALAESPRATQPNTPPPPEGRPPSYRP
jgi:hypothetical protein